MKFFNEDPIKSKNEDSLNRHEFVEALSQALLNWDYSDSLVIALNGPWGSGKTSILNLIREKLEATSPKKNWLSQKLKVRSSQINTNLIILNFNSWLYSNKGSLTDRFFLELAHVLKIKGATNEHFKLARKFERYRKLLSSLEFIKAPRDSMLLNVVSVILIFALFRSDFSPGLQEALVIVVFLLRDIWPLVCKVWSSIVNIGGAVLAHKSKSITELKDEISNHLNKSKVRLLIIIDEIDRLTQDEIKEVLRLVRVNADFPNTKYLLAFDRDIVEKNLDVQCGVSGREFLDKVVQARFDIPFIISTKISSFLYNELNQVIGRLPIQDQEVFSTENSYWQNVLYSGYKDIFRNLRDIKRYFNTLNLNLSLLIQDEVLEVHPVDFFAIEAIRIFAPSIHKFICENKVLFTSLDGPGSEFKNKGNNTRRNELEDFIQNHDPSIRNYILSLIRSIFPQINDVYQYGYITLGDEHKSLWSRDKRICSEIYFYKYFTFTPDGGKEHTVSQFELEEFLKTTKTIENLTCMLKELIHSNKIRDFLERLQDFTRDSIKVPLDNRGDIIQALYNISDEIPDETYGMYDFGADTDLSRIVYQLLKRSEDKSDNYDMLQSIIPLSKGMLGPFKTISLATSLLEDEGRQNDHIVPEENIQELQNLCLNKAKSATSDDLLKCKKHLRHILFLCTQWGGIEVSKNMVTKIMQVDAHLILFLETFVENRRSRVLGDIGVSEKIFFNYDSLKEYVHLVEVKKRVEGMPKENEVIQLFLKNFPLNKIQS